MSADLDAAKRIADAVHWTGTFMQWIAQAIDEADLPPTRINLTHEQMAMLWTEAGTINGWNAQRVEDGPKYPTLFGVMVHTSDDPTLPLLAFDEGDDVLGPDLDA